MKKLIKKIKMDCGEYRIYKIIDDGATSIYVVDEMSFEENKVYEDSMLIKKNRNNKYSFIFLQCCVSPYEDVLMKKEYDNLEKIISDFHDAYYYDCVD